MKTCQGFIKRRKKGKLLGIPLMKFQAWKKEYFEVAWLFKNLATWFSLLDDESLPFSENFFFNFLLQSETAGTIWLFKPEHRKNCSDWLHILLFFTCFVLVNLQKFVVIQNLHFLLFPVSNATNHPNQNCLPAEQNLVTWRNISSWLCILLFPSRQQGSSWCNLSNSLFNT